MKNSKKTILLSIFLVISLSGCYLKSLHPLVEPKDSIEVTGLSGSWMSESQRWSFIYSQEDFKQHFGEDDFDAEFEDDQPYLVMLEHFEDNETDTVLFQGSFVRIGNSDYMDLKPMMADYRGKTIYYESDLYTNHLFPVHTFSKIELNDDDLRIYIFKSSWINEIIEDNRARIKHEKTEDGILLTASTGELQKFIEKYGATKDAYEEPVKLERKE
ncbi:MAG: hypothetical protein FH748_05910 [Balneolaceae bacterium]|nr:hypothetical protein [Balneolaceae bacterium]